MSLKLPKPGRRAEPSTSSSTRPEPIYGRPLRSCLRPENEVGEPKPAGVLLDEASFVANLRARFEAGRIYTSLGSSVISLNPYQRLAELYSPEVVAAYQHHSVRHLPPHIYALCEYVLSCLRERPSLAQCIFVTGVGGSGKTESFQLAFDYFLNGSRTAKHRLSLVPKVLQAFGNASTDSNANSTRLFYLLEMDVDFRGEPLGGQISDHFLEKTRVARYEMFGLNFHVFYYLVGGAPANLLKYLKLQRNVDHYYLLKGKSPAAAAAATTHEDFQRLKCSLQVLGFSSCEIIELFQLIALVLKVGQLQFLRRANIDSTEGCNIMHDYEIVDICEAFGLDADKFRRLITQRVVRASENDVFIAELCAAGAQRVRNCVCKTLYFRLVAWLIGRMNELIGTNPTTNTTTTTNTLALFDSIGFEEYEINFLEQLLANYLYEKEQQVFLDVVYHQRREEAAREEIPWQPIELATNDAIVDMIERPKTGLLVTLNENSGKAVYFREEIFIEDLRNNCAGDLHFTEVTNPVWMDADGNGRCTGGQFRRLSAGDISKARPQLCFAIKHYQATVVYSVNGFMDKNNDHLSREWSTFFRQSEHCLLRTLFPEGDRVLRKGAAKPITLADQFSIALEALIAKLQSKEIHFIKCLRPNRLKMPNMFDDEYVGRQVSSQFLVEANYLVGCGYFFCESYSSFWRRFRVLLPTTTTTTTKATTDRHGCEHLVQLLTSGEMALSPDEFAFGKTKIFVRQQHTVIELEERRARSVASVVLTLQRHVRGWLARRHYARLAQAANIIANAFFRWQRRRYLLWLRHHLPSRSPLSRQWPGAPKNLRETSMLLRRLYHRWRCHRYRLRFDQINRNRMREKVTASSLFKGRKVSYRSSVAHPFRGDYIRLRKNAKWKRMTTQLGEMYVVFADLASKVTKRCGKFVPKLVVVSTTSFLILDHRTMQVNHHIRLDQIHRICASPYADNILIVNIYADQRGLRPSKAIIFESSHLIELVTKLFLVVQNACGRGPAVEIYHEFTVDAGKKESLVVVFKARSTTGQQQPSSGHRLVPSQARVHRKGQRLEIAVN